MSETLELGGTAEVTTPIGTVQVHFHDPHTLDLDIKAPNGEVVEVYVNGEPWGQIVPDEAYVPGQVKPSMTPTVFRKSR